MTRAEMLRHAEEWIAAWNRGDVERVLADFAERARFVSPRAALIVGKAELHGKAAIGAYWRRAIEKNGVPRFRLDSVICDPERREMVVIYDRLNDGTVVRACEFMRFDKNSKQIEGEAMYGADRTIAMARG